MNVNDGPTMLNSIITDKAQLCKGIPRTISDPLDVTEDREESPDETKDEKSLLNLNDYDVICGRNSIARNHIGNIFFRKMINEHRLPYQSAGTRVKKNQIIKEVISAIQKRGGRFFVLPNDHHSSVEYQDDCTAVACLVEISYKCIYEKVSHSLRATKTDIGKYSAKSTTPSENRYKSKKVIKDQKNQYTYQNHVNPSFVNLQPMVQAVGGYRINTMAPFFVPSSYTTPYESFSSLQSTTATTMQSPWTSKQFDPSTLTVVKASNTGNPPAQNNFQGFALNNPISPFDGTLFTSQRLSNICLQEYGYVQQNQETESSGQKMIKNPPCSSNKNNKVIPMTDLPPQFNETNETSHRPCELPIDTNTGNTTNYYWSSSKSQSVNPCDATISTKSTVPPELCHPEATVEVPMMSPVCQRTDRYELDHQDGGTQKHPLFPTTEPVVPIHYNENQQNHPFFNWYRQYDEQINTCYDIPDQMDNMGMTLATTGNKKQQQLNNNQYKSNTSRQSIHKQKDTKNKDNFKTKASSICYQTSLRELVAATTRAPAAAGNSTNNPATDSNSNIDFVVDDNHDSTNNVKETKVIINNIYDIVDDNIDTCSNISDWSVNSILPPPLQQDHNNDNNNNDGENNNNNNEKGEDNNNNNINIDDDLNEFRKFFQVSLC